jgi:hypothetical protein
MAVHKFKFAQVPLTSVKKLQLKNDNSASKSDKPTTRKSARSAPMSALSTTRSRSRA